MKTFVNSKPNNSIDFKEMMRRFLLKSKTIRHLSRSLALKNIIAQEAMNTYFQPIYDVRNNTTFGFEALNRPIALKLFQTADIFYEFVGQTDKVFCLNAFAGIFHSFAITKNCSITIRRKISLCLSTSIQMFCSIKIIIAAKRGLYWKN